MRNVCFSINWLSPNMTHLVRMRNTLVFTLIKLLTICCWVNKYIVPQRRLYCGQELGQLNHGYGPNCPTALCSFHVTCNGTSYIVPNIKSKYPNTIWLLMIFIMSKI